MSETSASTYGTLRGLMSRPRSATVGTNDKKKSSAAVPTPLAAIVSLDQQLKQTPVSSPIAEMELKSPKDAPKIHLAHWQKFHQAKEEESQLVDILREYLKKRADLETIHLKELEKLDRATMQKLSSALAQTQTQTQTVTSVPVSSTVAPAEAPRKLRRGSFSLGRPLSAVGSVFGGEGLSNALNGLSEIKESSNGLHLLRRSSSKINMQDAPKAPENALYMTIYTLVSESEKNNKIKGFAAEKTQNELAEKMKEISKELSHKNKKVSDILSKIQMDLNNEYIELERVRKTYQEMFTIYQKQFGDFDGKWTNLYSRGTKKSEATPEQKLTNARNDFVLQLEVVQNLYNVYYDEVLPSILCTTEGEFRKYLMGQLSNYVKSQQEYLKNEIESLDIAESFIRKLENSKESTIKETGLKLFPKHTLPILDLLSGDKPVDRVAWLDVSHQHPLYILLPLQSELKEWVERKEKEIKGLNGLRDAYWKNPSFGLADQTAEAEINALLEFLQSKLSYSRISSHVKVWAVSVPGWETQIKPTPSTKKMDLPALINAAKHPYTLSRSPNAANRQSIYSDKQPAAIETLQKQTSKTQSEKNETKSSSIQLAFALYDYHAMSGSEISLLETESVNILEDPESRQDGWIRCERNGKVGIVPCTYLQIVSSSSTTPLDYSEASAETLTETSYVEVTKAYHAINETELNLKLGDLVLVTSKESEDWWEGSLNGKTGQFPRAYVKMKTAQAPSSSSLSKKMVCALYDYEAQDPVELSFNERELIEVISETVDGDTDGNWILGKSTVTGKSGQIPRNYVVTAGK